MAIATGTAIAIAAGASAASSIASAKMQSNAAKNAAKTQSDAADKAMGVQQNALQQGLGAQQQQYQAMQQLYAPYTAMQPQSMAALNQFVYGTPGGSPATGYQRPGMGPVPMPSFNLSGGPQQGAPMPSFGPGGGARSVPPTPLGGGAPVPSGGPRPGMMPMRQLYSGG